METESINQSINSNWNCGISVLWYKGAITLDVGSPLLTFIWTVVNGAQRSRYVNSNLKIHTAKILFINSAHTVKVPYWPFGSKHTAKSLKLHGFQIWKYFNFMNFLFYFYFFGIINITTLTVCCPYSFHVRNYFASSKATAS